MSLRTDAIACGVCPDCSRPVPYRADMACPSCHQRRKEQLAALAQHGVGGQSCTDEMEAKMSQGGRIDGGANDETRRMHSGARNGQVFRKGEPYGG